MSDARERLEAANAAIAMAAHLLQPHRALFDEFMRESWLMESVGLVVDPTLYKSPERRATADVLEPVYRGAIDFLNTYERQTARLREALEKVNV